MTNEQKNQVAAMNASGMGVDEIAIDTKIDRKEIEEFVKERDGKHKISDQTRAAVIEYYQQGHTQRQCAHKYGVSQGSVHLIITGEYKKKKKEPAAAATAADSDVKTLQVKDSTVSAESQALRGVEVIGLMQTMLIGVEENFGDAVDIMSLRADSDTASIMFRYGGTAYSVQFGLAF